jgi:isopentenyl-diphosphate delta-isomerase
VYIGQFNGQPKVNSNEVSAWRWITPDLLNQELADPKKLYTPWLKLEWQRLNKDFSELFIKSK